MSGSGDFYGQKIGRRTVRRWPDEVEVARDGVWLLTRRGGSGGGWETLSLYREEVAEKNVWRLGYLPLERRIAVSRSRRLLEAHHPGRLGWVLAAASGGSPAPLGGPQKPRRGLGGAKGPPKAGAAPGASQGALGAVQPMGSAAIRAARLAARLAARRSRRLAEESGI